MKHAAIFVVIGMAGAAFGQQWLPGWGVPRLGTSSLYAITVWDRDGSGPADSTVVVGASGSLPNTVDAKLAYWDRGWNVLMTPSAPPLFAIAAHNGELYARSGDVTSWGISQANANVAHWDGTRWWSASMGDVSEIHTLFSYGDQLLAPASEGALQAWDGTAWAAFGTTTSGLVYGMTVHEGELIAAGRSLSKLTASGWQPWPVQIPGATLINAVASCNGVLYAAPTTGGLRVWNGNGWDVAPGVSQGAIYEMVEHGGELHCVGQLSLNGLSYEVLRYNGQEWRPLGEGLDNTVADMCMWRGQAVIAGPFVWAGGQNVGGIAVRSNGVFSPLGTGLRRTSGTASVIAVGVHGEDLFAAGNFTIAGGVAAAGIARWDGAAWSALGSGIAGGAVTNMVSHDGELVIAGNFTSAGGVPAAGVAAWNGATWRALGSGFTSSATPRPMAAMNGSLYLGLNSSAGASMQRWDGATWTQVGAAYASPSVVRSLIAKDGVLYAGGSFRPGLASVMNPSLKLTGNSWSVMGPNSSMVITDIIERDGALFAATSTARGIARWTGLSWAPETIGVPGNVLTLLNEGDDLLVGGSFTRVYHRLQSTVEFEPIAYFAVWRGDTCGTSDFNGDNQFGTDADIEAFFACLGGQCCATCWAAGADFDGNGDVGTDADIEAFFRVLAGGTC